MKNIILGMTGLLIMIYTLLIGINLYVFVTEKNLLEKHVSRAVENVLEEYYKDTSESIAENRLKEDILTDEDRDKTSIEIVELDLEKGLISVIVQKDVTLITGKVRQVSIEKTAIIEKLVVSHPRIEVSFMVGDMLYKQYQLTKGEVCPMPKTPAGEFLGWRALNDESSVVIQEIGNVWEDQVYYAVME